MTTREVSKEKPVFTLLPPHYHNEWVWKFLIKELDVLGFDAIAPHLDISDPNMTRDDHAIAMRKAEEKKGAENYIRGGSSWGGDPIYRQLGSHVSQLVFMGAPLRPILQRRDVPRRIPELANSPTLLYNAYVAGEKKFDRHELGEILYKRIGDAGIKGWAIENLEEHPHVHEDPSRDANAILPADIDMRYIGFINDEILPYSNQERTARFFGMDFTPFPTGHFGMLENPKLLAELLVEIAKSKIDKSRWWGLYKADRMQKLASSPPIKV